MRIKIAMVAVVVALGLGGVLLFRGISHHSGPPAPAPRQARPAAVTSPPPSTPPGVPSSRPVHVDVPRVGIHAKIIALGLNPDGSVGVPPLSQSSLAAWYDRGPTPGRPGPAVILGHVDTKRGPAAFFELGSVRPGDLINVTLQDGTVTVFAADSVEQVQKSDFPTARVYGDLSYPGIRLITCGGAFTGHDYLGNTIVYGHLKSTR